MSAKRERLIKLAGRIMELRTELQALETELNEVLGTVEVARIPFPPPTRRRRVVDKDPATLAANARFELEESPEEKFSAGKISARLGTTIGVARGILRSLARAGLIEKAGSGAYRAKAGGTPQ